MIIALSTWSAPVLRDLTRGWQYGNVSLTSHLDDKDSPIRAYFERAFPNTAELKFANTDDPPGSINLPSGPVEMHTLRRFVPPSARVLPDDQSRYPWALTGTALDYRLRYQYEIGDPESFTAYLGWQEVVRRPHGERAPDTGWTSLLGAIADLVDRANPAKSVLALDDELALSRMCGLLAMYEQIYRMGGIANPNTQKSRLFEVGLDASLDELLDLIDPRLPPDLAALVQLHRESSQDLSGQSQLVCNPEFARSRDLGGADADMMIDHALVELKTMKTAALSKKFAWQVLGYLLADTDDVYEIESVGWYFARQGYWWTFPVDEFLGRLASGNTTLPKARAEFADACASMRANVSRRAAAAISTTDYAPVDLSRVDYYSGRALYVQREVTFYPPKRGKGKWHTPLSEVPRLWSSYDEPNLDSPACGISIPLDLAADPRIPQTGTLQQPLLGDDLCARCRLYTEELYGASDDTN